MRLSCLNRPTARVAVAALCSRARYFSSLSCHTVASSEARLIRGVKCWIYSFIALLSWLVDDNNDLMGFNRITTISLFPFHIAWSLLFNRFLIGRESRSKPLVKLYEINTFLVGISQIICRTGCFGTFRWTASFLECSLVQKLFFWMNENQKQVTLAVVLQMAAS